MNYHMHGPRRAQVEGGEKKNTGTVNMSEIELKVYFQGTENVSNSVIFTLWTKHTRTFKDFVDMNTYSSYTQRYIQLL